MVGFHHLYIHVPFCQKKCPYCHFFVLKHHPQTVERYFKALERELELYRAHFGSQKLLSLYFGGGTPLLVGHELCTLLEKLRKWLDISSAEVTIEGNPELLEKPLLQALQEAGVNRLSVGIQSFDASELALLGRIPDPHAIERGIRVAQEVFDNISGDLICELPGQTLGSWSRTLARFVGLKLSHCSLYNLEFLPHSRFFAEKKLHEPTLPSEGEAIAQLELACTMLDLARYELSAFGRPSVHNMAYWMGKDYVGLGPSACGFLKGYRVRNAGSLSLYEDLLLKGKMPWESCERLSARRRASEAFCVRLRLIKGVPFLPIHLRSRMNELIQNGLCCEADGAFCLTKQGRLCYDTVVSELI